MKPTTRTFLVGLVSGVFLTAAGSFLALVALGVLVSAGIGGEWVGELMLRDPAVPAAGDGRSYGRADYGWKLQTLEGEAVSFSALQGKTVFLNLWSTWCGPCRKELPSIERLRRAPEATGVEFALVTLEEPEVVRDFVRRAGLGLPVYLATETPEVFAGETVPATFVVAPDGQVVFRHLGAAKWDAERFRRFLIGVSRPRIIPRRAPA